MLAAEGVLQVVKASRPVALLQLQNDALCHVALLANGRCPERVRQREERPVRKSINILELCVVSRRIPSLFFTSNAPSAVVQLYD